MANGPNNSKQLVMAYRYASGRTYSSMMIEMEHRKKISKKEIIPNFKNKDFATEYKTHHLGNLSFTVNPP
ncbi:hypothetical protein TUM16653_46420 [Enterobacter cloacae]|nr:hypothetical protein TUM16653_46420 [Enterobacter cloacae]